MPTTRDYHFNATQRNLPSLIGNLDDWRTRGAGFAK